MQNIQIRYLTNASDADIKNRGVFFASGAVCNDSISLCRVPQFTIQAAWICSLQETLQGQKITRSHNFSFSANHQQIRNTLREGGGGSMATSPLLVGGGKSAWLWFQGPYTYFQWEKRSCGKGIQSFNQPAITTLRKYPPFDLGCSLLRRRYLGSSSNLFPSWTSAETKSIFLSFCS